MFACVARSTYNALTCAYAFKYLERLLMKVTLNPVKNDGDGGTRAIRRALLQNFDIGLEDLEIVRRCIAYGETEHGARFLPRFPLTRLSLSHCDGDVAVAITGGRSRRPTCWVRR